MDLLNSFFILVTPTEISAASFTCENPEHDFSKKIVYQKDGDKLKATISGDGGSIDYFFEKVQCSFTAFTIW
jgi:hypothetical protein